MLTNKHKISALFLFALSCFLYFTLSIPSNSIWLDQLKAVDIAKDILDGNFPLVGYLHSNGMHSFPAFYYFIAPLVYISENPLFTKA